MTQLVREHCKSMGSTSACYKCAEGARRRSTSWSSLRLTKSGEGASFNSQFDAIDWELGLFGCGQVVGMKMESLFLAPGEWRRGCYLLQPVAATAVPLRCNGSITITCHNATCVTRCNLVGGT